ncbi:endolytic transglycosylase MltG [Amphibacillus sediminis]|uniref:endolytic transglycosylase MltG n=1 Tax=Amphibacillus sediminis TaxID=360185 RepID=UPI0009FAF10A|nr:endolytic transglycosylase MltG [Amphibacillus sediminis]
MSNSEHENNPLNSQGSKQASVNQTETDSKSDASDKEVNQTFKEERKKRFIQRCKEASLVRKIVFSIISLLILLIVFGGFSAYNYIRKGLSPVDPNSNERVTVEIPLGSSSTTIANILEDEGIINKALIYRIYLRVSNIPDFQAGAYELSPSMTLAEISDVLQSGSVMQDALFTVTIPEGRTLEEIAELYEKNANIDADEFMAVMQDEDYIRELIERYPNLLSETILDDDIRYPLEGYLFAATYPIYEESPSVDTIVTAMLDKTEDVVNQYYGEIQELDQYSIHELLTFASLVEREARNEDERKLIAGVFYNRLEEGMRLETDPTVLYALGEHKDRVLFSDLEIESPYNTYQIFGLPIGPISNFGESSLKAVLNPTDTNYLFFVAAPDGEIYFSETFDEHRSLANEHLDRDL